MKFSSQGTEVLLPVFIEAFLYGFLSLMFIISSRIIWHEHCNPNTPRARRVVNIKLFVVSSTMFILASFHMSTTMLNVLAIDDATGIVFLSLQNVVYGVQTLVSDGFMIYRMRAVWGRNNWVCLPIYCLFAATFVTSIECLYQLFRHPNTYFRGIWSIVFLLLTLITNACATALIAGRLWYIRFRLRSMPDYAGHSVYNRVCTAVAIFVESVAAYFLLIIPWVVTYAQGQWLAQIFFCAMPQVLGIIFTLVIVRISRGVAQGDHSGK